MIGVRVREDETAEALGAVELAQRYRSLVEHTPDGICVHERGVVVYVNPAVVRLIGAASADELIGKPLTSFVHPHSIPAMLGRIGVLTEAGDASEATAMTLVRMDGINVHVETVSVLTAWQGHLAHQVVIHDLTAQRRAEAAQRRAEQYFTTVVSQLEEGVVVIDPEGRIEWINPAAKLVFGTPWADDELIGKVIAALPLELLDSQAQPLPPTQHPVARTLATGETITGYVFGVDRADGQRRWLSGSSRLLNPEDPRSSAVSSFSDITEFRASRRQLEYQATHDSLTGLANRSLVLSQLARALAEDDGSISTVLFIDLDGFKLINDTLGHAIGDTVLQIVAQRLQRALRADDVVGRLGGDEFLVLLSDTARRIEIDELTDRLRGSVAEPVIARGHRIEINASIGVSTLAQADTRTAEAVLHDADLAMYRAKPPGSREGGIGGNDLPGDDAPHESENPPAS